MTSPRPRIGFVMSGGGSRGAYEVGVLQYLRTDLAKRLGRHVPLDVVTGTSVGAINAAFVAATQDDPATQAERMVAAWRSLHIEDLISMKPMDVLRAARSLITSDPAPPEPGSFRYGGLLNTIGLEKFVIKAIPWRGIERSLRAGYLHGITVSATHIGTGHTVVFTQTADNAPMQWSRDPFVRARPSRIGPRHVLASAAIPLLFPSVKIADEYFTDGGLRQNTPMSPALRLGSDRLLLISLRHVADVASTETPAMQASRVEAFPKPLFILGKALNALMLDHTEYDLARMSRLNHILDAGRAAFGASFEPMMNQELTKLRGSALRRIHTVHIRPSVDIGAIAAHYVASGKVNVSGALARRLIQRLAAGESRGESDLLSYLLFDGGYAAELIALGRSDAAKQEDELAALFDVGTDVGTGSTPVAV